MYPAKKFADRCGIKLFSASHCDIPGISWGVCRALCDADVKFLAADFPHYFEWGHKGLVEFWNSKEAFGYSGPGACYWKAPDGKKLLMWDSKTYVPESWDESFVEETINQIKADKYPYEVFRATVKTSNVDNSCFITDYADAALEWNKKYAYPHLVTSTNEMFYNAFLENAEKIGVEIPEMSGDMPGQDYPLGAMSMATLTMSARKTQARLVAAEKLMALVKDDEMVKNQDKLIEEIWRDLLFADDHAYGHHFSAGPAMKASYWEKGVMAMRAEANTQDVMDKAIASIADRIKEDGSDLRLVIFNPSNEEISSGLMVQMREFDNCGTTIYGSNADPTKLKGYVLNNRRRVNPEKEFWADGKFDLVDLETKKSIPYYLEDRQWDDPEYYAPESEGLGMGTNRYGFLENPGGLKRVLCFVAEDVPAFGYKCYALLPKEDTCAVAKPQTAQYVENGIYRIKVDDGISGILDLRTGKELLDLNCPYRLGDVLVRNGRKTDVLRMKVIKTEVKQNSVLGEIKIYGEVDGAHDIVIKVTVWQNQERIDAALRILKSAKPLQTMFMVFPFLGDGFKYEGMLCELEPAVNTVPGAQSDFLTVKDYVKVKKSNILWSSADTAVVALGKLWPGYISPAHSCIFERENHTPLKAEDFEGSGVIYAMLSTNNFCTNFMCSQVFDGVYKFSFGAYENADETFCALWGEQVQNPVIPQFTDRTRGDLPVSDSLISSDGLQVIMFKETEDKKAYIARIWNHSADVLPLKLKVDGRTITDFVLCDALENELYIKNAVFEDVVITVKQKVTEILPNTVITVRFNMHSIEVEKSMIRTGVRRLRDPFILLDDGVYYMYGTDVFGDN